MYSTTYDMDNVINKNDIGDYVLMSVDPEITLNWPFLVTWYISKLGDHVSCGVVSLADGCNKAQTNLSILRTPSKSLSYDSNWKFRLNFDESIFLEIKKFKVLLCLDMSITSNTMDNEFHDKLSWEKSMENLLRVLKKLHDDYSRSGFTVFASIIVHVAEKDNTYLIWSGKISSSINIHDLLSFVRMEIYVVERIDRTSNPKTTVVDLKAFVEPILFHLKLLRHELISYAIIFSSSSFDSPLELVSCLRKENVILSISLNSKPPLNCIKLSGKLPMEVVAEASGGFTFNFCDDKCAKLSSSMQKFPLFVPVDSHSQNFTKVESMDSYNLNCSLSHVISLRLQEGFMIVNSKNSDSSSYHGYVSFGSRLKSNSVVVFVMLKYISSNVAILYEMLFQKRKTDAFKITHNNEMVYDSRYSTKINVSICTNPFTSDFYAKNILSSMKTLDLQFNEYFLKYEIVNSIPFDYSIFTVSGILTKYLYLPRTNPSTYMENNFELCDDGIINCLIKYLSGSFIVGNHFLIGDRKYLLNYKSKELKTTSKSPIIKNKGKRASQLNPFFKYDFEDKDKVPMLHEWSLLSLEITDQNDSFLSLKILSFTEFEDVTALMESFYKFLILEFQSKGLSLIPLSGDISSLVLCNNTISSSTLKLNSLKQKILKKDILLSNDFLADSFRKELRFFHESHLKFELIVSTKERDLYTEVYNSKDGITTLIQFEMKIEIDSSTSNYNFSVKYFWYSSNIDFREKLNNKFKSQVSSLDTDMLICLEDIMTSSERIVKVYSIMNHIVNIIDPVSLEDIRYLKSLCSIFKVNLPVVSFSNTDIKELFYDLLITKIASTKFMFVVPILDETNAIIDQMHYSCLICFFDNELFCIIEILLQFDDIGNYSNISMNLSNFPFQSISSSFMPGKTIDQPINSESTSRITSIIHQLELDFVTCYSRYIWLNVFNKVPCNHSDVELAISLCSTMLPIEVTITSLCRQIISMNKSSNNVDVSAKSILCNSYGVAFKTSIIPSDYLNGRLYLLCNDINQEYLQSIFCTFYLKIFPDGSSLYEDMETITLEISAGANKFFDAILEACSVIESFPESYEVFLGINVSTSNSDESFLLGSIDYLRKTLKIYNYFSLLSIISRSILSLKFEEAIVLQDCFNNLTDVRSFSLSYDIIFPLPNEKGHQQQIRSLSIPLNHENFVYNALEKDIKAYGEINKFSGKYFMVFTITDEITSDFQLSENVKVIGVFKLSHRQMPQIQSNKTKSGIAPRKSKKQIDNYVECNYFGTSKVDVLLDLVVLGSVTFSDSQIDQLATSAKSILQHLLHNFCFKLNQRILLLDMYETRTVNPLVIPCNNISRDNNEVVLVSDNNLESSNSLGDFQYEQFSCEKQDEILCELVSTSTLSLEQAIRFLESTALSQFSLSGFENRSFFIFKDDNESVYYMTFETSFADKDSKFLKLLIFGIVPMDEPTKAHLKTVLDNKIIEASVKHYAAQLSRNMTVPISFFYNCNRSRHCSFIIEFPSYLNDYIHFMWIFRQVLICTQIFSKIHDTCIQYENVKGFDKDSLVDAENTSSRNNLDNATLSSEVRRSDFQFLYNTLVPSPTLSSNNPTNTNKAYSKHIGQGLALMELIFSQNIDFSNDLSLQEDNTLHFLRVEAFESYHNWRELASISSDAIEKHLIINIYPTFSMHLSSLKELLSGCLNQARILYSVERLLVADTVFSDSRDWKRKLQRSKAPIYSIEEHKTLSGKLARNISFIKKFIPSISTELLNNKIQFLNSAAFCMSFQCEFSTEAEGQQLIEKIQNDIYEKIATGSTSTNKTFIRVLNLCDTLQSTESRSSLFFLNVDTDKSELQLIPDLRLINEINPRISLLENSHYSFVMKHPGFYDLAIGDNGFEVCLVNINSNVSKQIIEICFSHMKLFEKSKQESEILELTKLGILPMYKGEYLTKVETIMLICKLIEEIANLLIWEKKILNRICNTTLPPISLPSDSKVEFKAVVEMESFCDRFVDDEGMSSLTTSSLLLRIPYEIFSTESQHSILRIPFSISTGSCPASFKNYCKYVVEFCLEQTFEVIAKSLSYCGSTGLIIFIPIVNSTKTGIIEISWLIESQEIEIKSSCLEVTNILLSISQDSSVHQFCRGISTSNLSIPESAFSLESTLSVLIRYIIQVMEVEITQNNNLRCNSENIENVINDLQELNRQRPQDISIFETSGILESDKDTTSCIIDDLKLSSLFENANLSVLIEESDVPFLDYPWNAINLFNCTSINIKDPKGNKIIARLCFPFKIQFNTYEDIFQFCEGICFVSILDNSQISVTQFVYEKRHTSFKYLNFHKINKSLRLKDLDKLSALQTQVITINGLPNDATIESFASRELLLKSISLVHDVESYFKCMFIWSTLNTINDTEEKYHVTDISNIAAILVNKFTFRYSCSSNSQHLPSSLWTVIGSSITLLQNFIRKLKVSLPNYRVIYLEDLNANFEVRDNQMSVIFQNLKIPPIDMNQYFHQTPTGIFTESLLKSNEDQNLMEHKNSRILIFGESFTFALQIILSDKNDLSIPAGIQPLLSSIVAVNRFDIERVCLDYFQSMSNVIQKLIDIAIDIIGTEILRL